MEIDGVSVNFKLSCLMLLIKDEKDWENEFEHLSWLEQKVNDCCLYFMTKEYKSMYFMNLELCLIDVHFVYEIPESCQNLLDAMQANIAEYGVRLNIHMENEK